MSAPRAKSKENALSFARKCIDAHIYTHRRLAGVYILRTKGASRRSDRTEQIARQLFIAHKVGILYTNKHGSLGKDASSGAGEHAVYFIFRVCLVYIVYKYGLARGALCKLGLARTVIVA